MRRSSFALVVFLAVIWAVFFAVFFGVLGCFPFAPAGGIAAAAVAGRFTRIAAAGEKLIAVRDGAFVSMGTDGRVLGRCAALEPPPPRGTRTRTGAVDIDDALRLAGLPDDEDATAEAEDALRDENLVRARAARNATTALPEVRDVAVVAGMDESWIASSIGLYRNEGGGCRAAALRGRDLGLVAAGAAAVAAASDELVWLFSPGATSHVATAGLTSRPRALAIQDDGGVLIAGDDGLIQLRPDGATNRLLDQGTDLAVVCAGIAVALTGDGTFRWTLGSLPERTGDRPPVRALSCGSGGDARFVAAGLGVWTSTDGTTWVERPGWSGSSIAGVAASARHIWLIADERLRLLAPGASDPDGAVSAPERVALPLGPALAPLPTARLTAPVFPWPQVGLLAAAQRTPARWGWAIEVLIAFPLGRLSGHRADRRPLAIELVRRDHGLAAEEAGLASVPRQDAESAALLRALRQERAALR